MNDYDDDVRLLFGTLAVHLGYLGRSESWVEGSVVADDAELPSGTDAYPHVDGHRGDRGWEQVSLMASEVPDSYNRWREQCVSKALELFPIPTGKRKPSKKQENDRVVAAAPYPIDLVDALQRDTAWWKRYRWRHYDASTHARVYEASAAVVTTSLSTITATRCSGTRSRSSHAAASLRRSGHRVSLPPLARNARGC